MREIGNVYSIKVVSKKEHSMEDVIDKSVYNDLDENKEIMYAEGVIKHFTLSDEDRSLYFDGDVVESGEHIHRNIKLSKRVAGYKSGSDTPLSKDDFPKRNDIYNARIMIESWEWNGHNCKRVLAFELLDYVGKNKSYVSENKIANPFNRFNEQDSLIGE